MKLALRELRRRPGRFTGATLTVAVLSFLVLFLGGLLDGLYLGSTGAIRAQDADVFVYSSTSRDSFLRSRITPETRAAVEGVEGVDRTGGLGIALLGAAVPGETDLADVSVIGYELPPIGVPEPPAPGEAWADERLTGFGVDEGDTLLVGPAQIPITVVGFVQDTNYLLQGALWVQPETWREVQNASRPDAAVADDTFQVLVVQGQGDPADLAAAIDAATADLGTGATSSLTKDEAELSLPGTAEQRSTFLFIIGATLAVVVAVVALFFALLTLERVPLYGVIKAIGGSSRQLFTGVVAQAIVVTLIGFVIGGGLAYVLAAAAPPQVPLTLTPSRTVTTLVYLVICAVIGSLLSLRRVVRIDPATAIGSGA
jgi:putative ABC transport system permease protein